MEPFINKNVVYIGEQEKESIIRMRMGKKDLPLVITVCHHSASLVMPIGDPQNIFPLSHPHTHDHGYIIVQHVIPPALSPPIAIRLGSILSSDAFSMRYSTASTQSSCGIG